MSYSDWATEYEQQAEHLQNKLTALKEQRKNCKKADIFEELSRRINSIYSMYLEAMHTAKLLRERATEGLIL
jgi:ppGpp synthetase/RelA/SpoT-type nucleotidyltranferase